jgi:hypothetical protein
MCFLYLKNPFFGPLHQEVLQPVSKTRPKPPMQCNAGLTDLQLSNVSQYNTF